MYFDIKTFALEEVHDMSPHTALLPFPTRRRDRRVGSLAALVAVTALAPAAWGSTYLVTTELLPADRPLLAATMRALPIGLLLVAVLGQLPQGIWWARTAILGTLNIGLFFALLFVAAYRLPGGVAATMGAIQPLVVAGLAPAVLGERLTGIKLAAGVGGVAGVALLVLRSQAALDPLGIAAALGGAAVMATGVVLTMRWGRPAPLPVFTAWQLAVGGLLLAPVALVVEGPPPSLGIGHATGFAYLAIVGTALAYVLWFRGIERLGASAASFLALLSPVVATLLGIAVIGQTLTPLQAVGALLVLASVAAGQIRSRNRRDRPDVAARRPLPDRPVTVDVPQERVAA
jgi:probable blue pigment (indigoidine) exporter